MEVTIAMNIICAKIMQIFLTTCVDRRDKLNKSGAQL